MQFSDVAVGQFVRYALFGRYILCRKVDDQHIEVFKQGLPNTILVDIEPDTAGFEVVDA